MPVNDKIRQFILEKSKDRRRKIALTAAASVSITLVVSLSVIASLMLVLGKHQTPKSPDEAAETSAHETSVPESPRPAETPSEPDPDDVTGDTGAEPSDSPDGHFIPVPPDYDYTKPVPESPPVDKSFYDDALFIGDSRTEGFRMFAGLNNATFYSAKGLLASTTFTDHFIPPDGFDVPSDAKTGEDGTLTVAQAIEYGPVFGKIYIMLGINELGWPNVQAFIGYYRQLIGLIRKHNPDAHIYVQLIIPVSKSKSDTDEIYNNERIALFNRLIAEMCAEEKVFYINTPEAVVDENGALPEDAGIDGVHMKKLYCERWRDYLFTHTVHS